MPPLSVYVDPISYLVSTVHVCDTPGVTFEYVCDAPVPTFEYVCDTPGATFEYVVVTPGTTLPHTITLVNESVAENPVKIKVFA
tara:strand:+ start:165 stop:416 length:252 start_codon:yes stop_codon:yes gene_type:complete